MERFFKQKTPIILFQQPFSMFWNMNIRLWQRIFPPHRPCLSATSPHPFRHKPHSLTVGIRSISPATPSFFALPLKICGWRTLALNMGALANRRRCAPSPHPLVLMLPFNLMYRFMCYICPFDGRISFSLKIGLCPHTVYFIKNNKEMFLQLKGKGISL